MRNRRAAVELENSLPWFMGRIMIEQQRSEGCFESDCQEIREEIEAAKEPLQRLGMYEEVVSMLARVEWLVRENRHDDADALVCHVRNKLMEKSGSWDRFERRFAGVKPGDARMPRLGDLIHGFGPPEPDTYQGQFFQRAAPGEIQKIVVIASQLQVLKVAFAMATAGRGKDLEERIAKAAVFGAAAEVPLRKMGLYRMLSQTFEAARSLCAEKDYPAAEELVDELAGYLQERLEGGVQAASLQ